MPEHEHTCKWVTKTKPFTFCGDKAQWVTEETETKPEVPYCLSHALILQKRGYKLKMRVAEVK